jgi:D-glycero-D-manno-heptose 1,7-bisphosphate phosphatase
VSRPAVFLDRDGVLNDPVLDPVDGTPESPLRAADVVLAPGAAEGVLALQRAGILLIVVSNQPAAAKGKVTAADLRAVHERVVALLAARGATIDDWRYCFHRREDGCACRKPAPGMLLDAAAEHDLDLTASWIVGDTDSDVGAGRAAGCGTVLVTHPGSAHRRPSTITPDVRVRNLEEAATFVLPDGRLRSPTHA